MRPSSLIGEQRPKTCRRGLRHDGLIGLDNVDFCPGSAQLARNNVARDAGTHQQHTPVLHPAA